MKKLVTALCVLVFLEYMVCMNCRAAQTDPGQLYARGACLMDGDSGRILYGKNETQEMAMASTTKIMTCILLLENCDLTEAVTASAHAADQPKVRLGVTEGQRFLLGDLLYALMLESYNDAAVMLAEHLDGSVEAFARRMNEKSAELGCVQTHFVTPNGLDATDDGGIHHTTAADLAMIMRYCVEESPQAVTFQQITQTQNHTFSDLDKTKSYSCSNHNQLLQMTDGVLSGKTGFTNDAGYCYVCAVESEGRTFVITLLGCGWPGNKTWKWKDTLQLLGWAKETYHLRKLQPLSLQKEIPVADGVYRWEDGPEQKQTVDIQERLPEDTKKSWLLAEGETLRAVYSYPAGLTAPVKAGTQVGSVQYMSDDTCIAEYPLVLMADRNAVTLYWCRQQILVHFLGKNLAAD